MKKFLAIVAATTLASHLVAQSNTVATDPVGYLQYVYKANSDTATSLPLHRPPEYVGAVQQVGSNWISVDPSQTSWPNNEWTYGVGTNANSRYYLQFKSGAIEGLWFQVTGNNSNTLFLDTSGGISLVSEGVTTSNSFEVIPFWTLATVFPNGQGIVPSNDPFDPKSLIIMQDQETAGINLSPRNVYLYYDGSQGGYPAGFYVLGDPDQPVVDDNPIRPDAYFLIRSTETQTTNTVVGSVAMHDFATFLGNFSSGTPQDNPVGFGFPVDTRLGDAGLESSPGFVKSNDPFDPKDLVLVYDQDSAGINKAPKEVYLYYDGSQGGYAAGWYPLGDPDAGLQDSNMVFRAGSGVIIRKASAPAGADLWTATPSYAGN